MVSNPEQSRLALVTGANRGIGLEVCTRDGLETVGPAGWQATNNLVARRWRRTTQSIRVPAGWHIVPNHWQVSSRLRGPANVLTCCSRPNASATLDLCEKREKSNHAF